MEDLLQRVSEIWKAFGRGPLEKVQWLTGGRRNINLEINGRYVLRLLPATGGLLRLAREKWILQQVSPKLPVPEPLDYRFFDRPKPLEALLLSQIPGQPLHRLWPNLASSEKRRVTQQLADLLRYLHQQDCSGWGQPDEEGRFAFSSWKEYLQSLFSNRLRRVLEEGHLAPQLAREIEKKFAEGLGFVEQTGKPVWVHRDFHPGNILVKSDQITGILDWETALGAPQEYELDVLFRFSEAPEVYLGREASPSLADFLPLFQQAYPELFSHPLLKPQLELYSLITELRLIALAPTEALQEEALHRLLRILKGHHPFF